MNVLRRSVAVSRLLNFSRPQSSLCSSASFCHVQSGMISTPLLHSSPHTPVSHFVAAAATGRLQRSFHSAARQLPAFHHRHLPLTRHPAPNLTHCTTSHPCPLHPVLFSYQPVRRFRKGRKGARTKLKSHSGSKKRFRFTRNGVIMRWRAGKSHKNTNKSSARLRRLSKPVEVYHGHVKMIRRSLPYGMRHSR